MAELDNLSIKITSDAQDASAVIDKLIENAKKLRSVMKSLDSMKNGGKSTSAAADGVSKSMKEADSGAKQVSKSMKEVSSAANEAKKATESMKKVAENIKPKVDTSEINKAKATMDDFRKAMTAQNKDQMGKYADTLRHLRGQNFAKGGVSGQATMSDEERIRRQNEWLFGDASGTPPASTRKKYASDGVKASDVFRVANEGGVSVEDATQLLKEAQAANEASSANNSLASSSERVINAQMAMRNAVASGASSISGTASSISRMRASAGDGASAMSSLGTRIRSIPWRLSINGANLMGGAMRKMRHGVNFAKGAVQGFAGQVAKIPFNFMKKVLNVATFGQLGKGANDAKQGVSGLGQSIQGGLKGIMKYVLGFRTLFYLVRAIRQGIAEGFTNLASVNDKTNQSLSMLKSRLTQVKNGLASAFAPVLNAVAPILNTLIGYLMDGINAVAQFFAALTGQSTWQKAVYKMQDFSAGASSAGSAADGANESAKELQKTLLSFDKINKLNDNDSGSGSGGSGGGSGGGGGAAGAGMFTTETVSTGISNFAQMVKDAWNTADFTQVGATIGQKLKDALDNIPWDTEIKPMAEKVGKSLGTLITGFVEVPGLATSIGKTIAEAMNTVMSGLNSFLENVHWDSLGKFVMEAIGGVLDNFDYELAAETGSNLLIAIQDYVAGCIEGVNWKELPSKVIEKVKEFLSGIKWKEELASLGNLAGTALKAVFDFASGMAEVISGIGEKIKKYFVDEMEKAGFDSDKSLAENGKAIITGILNGIKNFLSSGWTWVNENIFTPFVDGFKGAFGIHSPASNTDIVDLGKNLIEGIFNGVLEWMGGIKEWLKTNVLDKITGAWGELTEKGGNLLGNLGKMIFGDGTTTDESGTSGHSGKVKVTVSGETDDSYKATKDDVLGFAKNRTPVTTAKGNENDSTWTALKKGWASVQNKTAQVTTGVAGKFSDVKSFFKKWDGLKKKGSNKKKATLAVSVTGKTGTVSDMYNKITGIPKYKKTVLEVGAEMQKNVTKITKGGKILMDTGLSFAEKDRQLRALGFAKGGSYYGGSWHNIPQYAMGAAPTHGSLFVAGESGAEAVGHINGRTEVLNRSQMASVMYQAVLRGMTQALMSSGNNSPTVVISADSKGIFKVVQTEANNYTNMTGRPAFNI